MIAAQSATVTFLSERRTAQLVIAAQPTVRREQRSPLSPVLQSRESRLECSANLLVSASESTGSHEPVV